MRMSFFLPFPARRPFIGWVLLALLGYTLGLASGHASECAENCVADGEWETGIALGIGYANNPLIDGDDLKLPLLPRIAYYGEHFFFENATLGYTLHEDPQWRFNLLGRPNLDYLYFSQSGSFYGALNPPFPSPHPYPGPGPAELKNRRMTYLGGMEVSWFHQQWQIQGSVLRDISVGHHGVEADIAAIYHWRYGLHQLDAALALKYRDQRLSDYYYGLDRGEFVDPKFDYKTGATLSPYTTLNYRYDWTEDTHLIALFALQRVDDGIADSPIVTTRWFSAGFLGVAYDF